MPNSVTTAISLLREGSLVIVVDDCSESANGYFCAPAGTVSAAQVSAMVNDGRGVICAALADERYLELGLPMMAAAIDQHSPQFTVTVEARHNVSTGISAADRAETLRVLARTKDPKRELVMPGHIFPVRAKKGGVLVQNTAAEAMIDLLDLAGLPAVAAFCHILNDDGDYATEEELSALAARNQLHLISVSDLVRYRMAGQRFVARVAEAKLPTKTAGEFRAIAFTSLIDQTEHLALVRGDIGRASATPLSRPILARVQSENRIGDLFGLDAFPQRQTLHGALQAIAREGEGVFVYIRHAQTQVLSDQIEAVANGVRTAPKTSQLRELGIGAQILKDLGVRKIRLLTNSKRQIPGLAVFDLEIVEQVGFPLPKLEGADA